MFLMDDQIYGSDSCGLHVFRLPLETMKEKVRSNLDVLEKERVVTRTNNYQSLINSIVQVNQMRELQRKCGVFYNFIMT